MFKTISSLLTQRSPLHAEIGLDHLELSADHLIIGLQLAWFNRSRTPINIDEVVVNIYHKGKKETPIEFVYHGRFVRIPFQKSITKINGANSFHLKPGSNQVECLRFLTREIRDLGVGNYHAELVSVVAEGSYLHDFNLRVVPQLKSHAPGSESATNPLGTSGSSAYTRALRFGS